MVPMYIAMLCECMMIINARRMRERMREGYCSHPVCLCVCVSVCLCICVSVCLCVCVSVTALALTYDACATKLAYQCILRCTQKVLNWAFSLKSLLSRVPSLFSLSTAERAAILKHWSCYVDFNDHYQQLSMFNDCVQRIRRPLPHATTITKGRQIFLQYTVYTLPRGDLSWSSWSASIRTRVLFDRDLLDFSWSASIRTRVLLDRDSTGFALECEYLVFVS